jgi:hypothetical protein
MYMIYHIFCHTHDDDDVYLVQKLQRGVSQNLNPTQICRLARGISKRVNTHIK